MKKYSSYKDSGVEWIGNIPNHWLVKGLRFSFNVNKGKIPKNLTDQSGENLYPYLSMDVLRDNPPTEFSTQDDGLLVRKGDIGILWDGSNSGEIISINQDGILSSTVSKLSITDSKLNKDYSYYLLKYYEKDFRENTIGMGIPHMDGNHLKFSKIILPTLSEQQQIVSFLDDKTQKIDSLIQHKEKKIELLKEKRTSLINHVVTKGLDPNVEIKDSGVKWIGEIPSHWVYGKIKYLSEIISKGTTPSTVGREVLDEGSIFYIKVENIKERTVEIPPINYIDEETDRILSRSSLIENDILVVITGSTTGKVVILPKEFSPSNTNQGISFIRLKNKSNENVRFTWFWLSSEIVQELIKITYTQSTQPNLSMEDLGNFYIPIPPISEQQQIVDYLDEQTEEIDTLIQLEQNKIELLKEYRQSLISEVVTGKVRVCEEDHSLNLETQNV